MPYNRTLRQKWVTADYDSRMGSACVVPPPPKEFIRVYHITSAGHAISNIKLGRLKVARFSDANDPFELLALNFMESGTRVKINNFKKHYDSHTGFLSFSENWTNPVLWSHYGAKQQGICLGFDLIRTRAQWAKYSDQRILATLDQTENDLSKIDKKLLELLRCTKFHHWGYEKEVRTFVPLKDVTKEGHLYFFPFDSGLQLKEVILGPLCDESLSAVRNIANAKYPGVTTFSARLAWGSFDVVPKESTVP